MKNLKKVVVCVCITLVLGFLGAKGLEKQMQIDSDCEVNGYHNC